MRHPFRRTVAIVMNRHMEVMASHALIWDSQLCGQNNVVHQCAFARADTTLLTHRLDASKPRWVHSIAPYLDITHQLEVKAKWIVRDGFAEHNRFTCANATQLITGVSEQTIITPGIT